MYTLEREATCAYTLHVGDLSFKIFMQARSMDSRKREERVFYFLVARSRRWFKSVYELGFRYTYALIMKIRV